MSTWQSFRCCNTSYIPGGTAITTSQFSGKCLVTVAFEVPLKYMLIENLHGKTFRACVAKNTESLFFSFLLENLTVVIINDNFKYQYCQLLPWRSILATVRKGCTLTMTAIYLCLTVIFASTVQAVSGFGFNIVGAPLLMLFIAPKQVISLTIFGALILNLMVIHKTRGQGDFYLILPMFAASIVGVLPGVYFLNLVDGAMLKIVVGTIVILMSIALAANFFLCRFVVNAWLPLSPEASADLWAGRQV